MGAGVFRTSERTCLHVEIVVLGAAARWASYGGPDACLPGGQFGRRRIVGHRHGQGRAPGLRNRVQESLGSAGGCLDKKAFAGRSAAATWVLTAPAASNKFVPTILRTVIEEKIRYVNVCDDVA